MNTNIIEIALLVFMYYLLATSLIIFINRISEFKKIKLRLNEYTSIEKLTIDLNKKMTTLYTISTNVVYVGLLGTVIGVIFTLKDLTNLDKTVLVTNLSFALIATASSLVVAIPSTVFYNYLVSKIENISMEWKDEYSKKN